MMLLYNNDDDSDVTYTSSITVKIGFTAVTFTMQYNRMYVKIINAYMYKHEYIYICIFLSHGFVMIVMIDCDSWVNKIELQTTINTTTWNHFLQSTQYNTKINQILSAIQVNISIILAQVSLIISSIDDNSSIDQILYKLQ